MDRQEAISRIKAHEPELRAAGIAALYLFGSTARGDANPMSDVDLSCELSQDKPISLLDFIGMEQNLAEILGKPVDLVEQDCLTPIIARHASRDMVRIF